MLFTLPLFVLYQHIVGTSASALPMTVIMIVAGFLFCSVSAYMAGLVGSSNNPVSGITICTILFASLVLLLLMGRDAALGPVAAIMIGAVVCCAACIGGDNLQDLKAGTSSARRRGSSRSCSAIGAVACALVMAPVLNLLLKAYGIGVPTAAHPNPLLAPQATLMASVAQGHVRRRAAVGHDRHRRRDRRRDHRARRAGSSAQGAKFRVPVLAVAVGIYLPLELIVPIFLGGLLAWFERTPRRTSSHDGGSRRARKGMLFAAGLITGEALMGIVIAIPIVVAGAPTCSRCRPSFESASRPQANGSGSRCSRCSRTGSIGRRRPPKAAGPRKQCRDTR